MVLIHNSLSCYETTLPDSIEAEYICVKVTSILKNGEDLVVCSYYNPPSTLVNTELLESVSKSHKNVIIIGDLNSHNTIWHDKTTDKNGKKIEDFINNNNYVITNNHNFTYHPPHQNHGANLDLALLSPEVTKYFKSYEVLLIEST